MVYDVLLFLRDPAGPFEVKAKEPSGAIIDIGEANTIDEAVRMTSYRLGGAVAFRLQAQDDNQW
jgi:hypothetical protein